jgi:hypothetical protein
MAYSKAKLKSSGDKASPYYIPLGTGNFNMKLRRRERFHITWVM